MLLDQYIDFAGCVHMCSDKPGYADVSFKNSINVVGRVDQLQVNPKCPRRPSKAPQPKTLYLSNDLLRKVNTFSSTSV